MSEKLLPCPFCGGEARIGLTNRTKWEDTVTAFCDRCNASVSETGRVQSEATKQKVTETWNRRTPAPEGEVSLWGCADGNGIDPRLVFRDRPTAEQVAADTNMVAQPLYASPVVPVGVSNDEPVQRVKVALALAGYRTLRMSLDAATDAILAAFRPTDTGREA